jgi:hypothetical protein
MCPIYGLSVKLYGQILNCHISKPLQKNMEFYAVMYCLHWFHDKSIHNKQTQIFTLLEVMGKIHITFW